MCDVNIQSRQSRPQVTSSGAGILIVYVGDAKRRPNQSGNQTNCTAEIGYICRQLDSRKWQYYYMHSCSQNHLDNAGLVISISSTK
jgi:hypothetical protein